MTQKLMKRFDSTNENVKKMWNDLSWIVQKINANVVSIKQLEQQMNQLSTRFNQCQPGALPRSTMKNPKNMSIIWQSLLGGENISLIYQLSKVNIVVEKDDYQIEIIRESMNCTKMEAKISQKVVPMHTPPPPFP